MDVVKIKSSQNVESSGEFQCEFANLKFLSQKNQYFRASITCSGSSGTVIWLENKKSKNQWQVDISKVGDCGPAGIPDDVVIGFLKQAFKCNLAEYEDTKRKEDDPELDLQILVGEAVLTLTVSIGNIWKPKFVFTLPHVSLERLDVLEAKLRDSQEEIESLKFAREVAFLSISSQVACGSQQIVVWNGNEPREVTNSHFRLSPDMTQVTVLMNGVYQINIRLAGTNNANTQFLALLRNDVDIAQCTQSDANNHQNTAQLFEIVRLKAHDVLKVRCGANGNSLAVRNGNRFTVLFLGAN